MHLLKEEQPKGLNTKIIHKHQPCAWGLTVVTERKGASYDQTFVKVAKNAEEAMETFVKKILEITQQVYQHEQMLIPHGKARGDKESQICHSNMLLHLPKFIQGVSKEESCRP